MICPYCGGVAYARMWGVPPCRKCLLGERAEQIEDAMRDVKPITEREWADSHPDYEPEPSYLASMTSRNQEQEPVKPVPPPAPPPRKVRKRPEGGAAGIMLDEP